MVSNERAVPYTSSAVASGFIVMRGASQQPNYEKHVYALGVVTVCRETPNTAAVSAWRYCTTACSSSDKSRTDTSCVRRHSTTECGQTLIQTKRALNDASYILCLFACCCCSCALMRRGSCGAQAVKDRAEVVDAEHLCVDVAAGRKAERANAAER